MAPEGCVSNHNLLSIMLQLLFQCCVAILRKDNLAWCVQGALLLTRRLFPRVRPDLSVCDCSGTAKNLLGSLPGDLSFTQALTRRFVSRYPRAWIRRDAPAFGLERGWLARRQREEKRSRGHLPSPPREVCERENTSEPEPENAARGGGIESAKNTRSKL